MYVCVCVCMYVCMHVCTCEGNIKMVDTTNGTYKMEIPNVTATRRLKEAARETIKESSINKN